MRNTSLPISGHWRVARPIICAYRIRLFTRRRNTRLVIDGTSMPVVSRSTVTAIFGLASEREDEFPYAIHAAGDLFDCGVVDLAISLCKRGLDSFDHDVR